MKKTGKRLLAISMAIMVVMTMSITAFAATVATESFSVKLYEKQKDREVSTIARSNHSDTVTYATVTIDSIANDYTAVRAWMEKPAGANYSNPYTQIGIKKNKVNYSKVPDKGDNVVLNLDNPVYTTKTPLVKGSWTPN